eukprot:NODE_6850_length_603_cov_4.705776_g5861_i0.p2 GENE.NODE_6850_length_603_cov_4.705776_g5861_i0~~NODE_6850_length_603_cov_4.705776_g5861_i0.p2  ORF type:complete len:121 (+),score=9.53 NODE_6850_length_603_cov_4.705776_g5861_i0:180-542(+)
MLPGRVHRRALRALVSSAQRAELDTASSRRYPKALQAVGSRWLCEPSGGLQPLPWQGLDSSCGTEKRVLRTRYPRALQALGQLSRAQLASRCSAPARPVPSGHRLQLALAGQLAGSWQAS